MTDAAIIKATFSEWRMVKGRKVLQIICEVPLEAQGMVFQALGAPMPDAETWVAIARLKTEAELARDIAAITEDVPPALAPPRKPAKPSQIAGILCNTGAFRKWCGAATVDEAADYIRGHCNVASRADLDTHEDAAAIFRNMKGEYDAWFAAPEAFSPREEKARAA